jgi:para-aminobenzoate synthetase component 1
MGSGKFEDLLNGYGAEKIPVLFIVSYDLEDFHLIPLDSVPKDIRWSIGSVKDGKDSSTRHMESPSYSFESVEYAEYLPAFERVIEEIRRGNTYLLNLTFSSRFFCDMDLMEIYRRSDALFKLYFKDRFVCFSPERFVDIDSDGKIRTYPMKGTIDASIPDAGEKILSDPKETAEHIMIVDLLRNDLNRVAGGVRVERFRYLQKIKAGERELLQVSSRICGDLGEGWNSRLGTIISRLLPAGSITGTPKRSTVDIIDEVESHERGFFSGVFGIFDGERVDSAVMIRFIEKGEDGLIYKSGGGITIDSDPYSEYMEMREKIYVPFL